MSKEQKAVSGYSLNKACTVLKVWHFTKEGQLICTMTYKPIKGLKRKERYEVLSKHLKENLLMPPQLTDL